MISYFLSLNYFERILLVVGVLASVTMVINMFVEHLESVDRGVRRKSPAVSVVTAMGTVCMFCFLTLFMTSNGVKWYMAFPVSVLASLVCFMIMVVFHGDKSKSGTTDRRIAIGHTGLVYRTVLSEEPTGCVSVDVFGQTIDSFALSADEESLAVGTMVRIIDTDGDVLICRQINE